MEQKQYDANVSTLILTYDILTQLGCKPKVEEDGTISMNYQDQHFIFEFVGLQINILSGAWAITRVDAPELPMIREVINMANWYNGPTVILSQPNEDGIMGLFTRRDIMLHPNCSDNVQYMASVINSFFEAQNHIREAHEKISNHP